MGHTPGIQRHRILDSIQCVHRLLLDLVQLFEHSYLHNLAMYG